MSKTCSFVVGRRAVEELSMLLGYTKVKSSPLFIAKAVREAMVTIPTDQAVQFRRTQCRAGTPVVSLRPGELEAVNAYFERYLPTTTSCLDILHHHMYAIRLCMQVFDCPTVEAYYIDKVHKLCEHLSQSHDILCNYNEDTGTIEISSERDLEDLPKNIMRDVHQIFESAALLNVGEIPSELRYLSVLGKLVGNTSATFAHEVLTDEELDTLVTHLESMIPDDPNLPPEVRTGRIQAMITEALQQVPQVSFVNYVKFDKIEGVEDRSAVTTCYKQEGGANRTLPEFQIGYIEE